MKLTTLKPRTTQLNVLRTPGLTSRTLRVVVGRALQRRNRIFLLEHPLCAQCLRQGRTAAAREVDHVTPLHLGGPDDETNLQGLCITCHEAKSALEARDRQGAGPTL